jgi:hypothetical protein
MNGQITETLMKLKNTLVGVSGSFAIGALALIAAVQPASARMVCNGGDCWHTDSAPAVPGVHFDTHPDDWYFHQKWDGGDRHYRDYHEGRGYYKSGVWITL